MSLGTFFKKVGVDLEKVLTDSLKIAAIAEPVVDVLFPAVATLYNGAINEAVKTLAAAQSATEAGESVPANIDNIANAVAPQLIAYMQSQGLPTPTAAHITAFAQSIIASLQVLTLMESGPNISTVVTPSAGAEGSTETTKTVS
jgi:hypothetical protein